MRLLYHKTSSKFFVLSKFRQSKQVFGSIPTVDLNKDLYSRFIEIQKIQLACSRNPLRQPLASLVLCLKQK